MRILELLFVSIVVFASMSMALAQAPTDRSAEAAQSAEEPTPAARLVPWTTGVVSGLVIVAVALVLRRRGR